jgi:hypothetical protein
LVILTIYDKNCKIDDEIFKFMMKIVKLMSKFWIFQKNSADFKFLTNLNWGKSFNDVTKVYILEKGAANLQIYA